MPDPRPDAPGSSARSLRTRVGLGLFAATAATLLAACFPQPGGGGSSTTTTAVTTTSEATTTTSEAPTSTTEAPTTTTEAPTTTTTTAAFTPAVTFTGTTGLAQVGSTVTVTGSGFDPSVVSPSGNPGPAGVYVAIGVGSGPVPTAYTSAKFVRPTGPAVETASGAKLQADGTFSATIALPAVFAAQNQAVNCYLDACKVFVFSAHTGSYASWNFSTPVTFAAATTPQVAVSKVTGLAATGQAVTVTGAGFSASFPGIYLGQVPWTDATKTPGFATADAGEWGDTLWVSSSGPDPRAGGQARLNADGTFRTTLDVTKVIGASGNDCSLVTCSVLTVRAHGFPDLTPSQTTWIPLAFAGA